jgi:hypothetical protein
MPPERARRGEHVTNMHDPYVNNATTKGPTVPPSSARAFVARVSSNERST